MRSQGVSLRADAVAPSLGALPDSGGTPGTGTHRGRGDPHAADGSREEPRSLAALSPLSLRPLPPVRPRPDAPRLGSDGRPGRSGDGITGIGRALDLGSPG